MHSVMFTAIAAVAAMAIVARAADTTQPSSQPSTQPFATAQQTNAYAIGYTLGQQVKESVGHVDTEVLMQGLRDSLGNEKSKLTDDQYRAAMQQISRDMQANAAAAQKAAGELATKAGDDFRAENAKKPGVTVTKSGLQIETLKEGTGDSPKPTDTVKVHYTGKLIDGTVFDSSVERGQPISFPLNGVIPGWTEGLQLMKVGGKARLVIPPELGYGAAGAPPTIPPNSTLVFEVELLGIEKK